jgi:hypothetical protein
MGVKLGCKQGPRVFENRELRGISGLEREM